MLPSVTVTLSQFGSAALDGRHRPADRTVVEQPQVLVAALVQQRVGLLDIDLAAEEVGEDAAVVPGRVVLEAPLEVLEEQLRDPPLLDLLVDRAVLARSHRAGHQRRLALDREGAAGLVYVGGLAHQPRRLVHLWLAAAGHDHDLGAGPVAGLERPRLRQREAALWVAEQRAALAEQGPVEVGVDATQPQEVGYGSDHAARECIVTAALAGVARGAGAARCGRDRPGLGRQLRDGGPTR